MKNLKELEKRLIEKDGKICKAAERWEIELI